MADTLKSPNVVNTSVLSIVHPAIDDYMRGLLSVTDHEVLTEMETLAEQNNFPIVGRLVGVFLETMAKSVNAQRVFEFGSGYGYSAYWFARAVGANGQVICTEADLLNKEKAQQYLEQSRFMGQSRFSGGYGAGYFCQHQWTV